MYENKCKCFQTNISTHYKNNNYKNNEGNTLKSKQA